MDPLIRNTSTSSSLGRGAAVVTLVTLLGMVLYFGPRVANLLEQPDVGAEVVGQQVLTTDGGCVWALDAVVDNQTDSAIVVISGSLNGIDRSQQSVIGGAEPGESVRVVYELPLESCETDPATLDHGSLALAWRFHDGDDTEYAIAPIPSDG